MTPNDERHFLDAAEEGRVEEIRQFLGHGTCPDAVVDGWTALEKASIKNQCEAIKALIEAGADPDRQGCQMANVDSFLSLDFARVEGVGAQSRKGRNLICSVA